MWRVFWIFIFLGLIAGVAGWLADHPGTLRLDWLGYRIDTSVAVLVFAMALIAAVTAILYRFWVELRRAPRRILNALKERRRQRGFVALSQGLVAVASGDVADAKRQARRAESLLAEPAMTQLLSAQAAQLSGDAQAATRFFTGMLEQPDTEFLGLRGLLMQAMKRDDQEEALSLARRAFELQPKSDWVAKTLFELQVRSQYWVDAEKTLQAAIKHKALLPADVKSDYAAIHFQLSLRASDQQNDDEALKHANAAHNLVPAFIPAALRLAQLYITAGRPRKAVPVIEAAWVHEPHRALLECYWSATQSGDAMARVRTAQFLAGLNPDHLESRLAIGEAALEARLWGVARTQLEAAVETGATGRVCQMMASLAEAEHGDRDRAREWLMRVANAEPDPVWVCDSCGNAVTDWQAKCGKCDDFNSFMWRSPPRVLSLPDTNQGQKMLNHEAEGIPLVDAQEAPQ
ncbi:heme biosynthesis protein HemY [bacterium]|nr:heme biosynthesis protein HemY [bacterium]